jgi:thiol-disulfide isomerase/thioredoxin
MNSRGWLAALAVAAGAGLVWWAAHAYGRHVQTAGVAPEPGGDHVTLRFYRDPASVPVVALRDLSGNTIASKNWRGMVVIVNFWATWCPPCRAEIPALISLQQKYAGRLQIIGVSQDEGEGASDLVKQFAAGHQMNYPIVMMTPELDRAFPDVHALPTSYVLDRESRIVQRHVGLLDAGLAEQETRALAGLPVNASIEQVDRFQPAKLENAAQATDIPGVDLKSLTPAQRMAALQKLNTDPCTCGCDNTLAKCRIEDPKCTTSLPLAQKVVQDIAARP